MSKPAATAARELAFARPTARPAVVLQTVVAVTAAMVKTAIAAAVPRTRLALRRSGLVPIWLFTRVSPFRLSKLE